jgi:hypothetical protein
MHGFHNVIDHKGIVHDIPQVLPWAIIFSPTNYIITHTCLSILTSLHSYTSKSINDISVFLLEFNRPRSWGSLTLVDPGHEKHYGVDAPQAGVEHSVFDSIVIVISPRKANWSNRVYKPQKTLNLQYQKFLYGNIEKQKSMSYASIE